MSNTELSIVNTGTSNLASLLIAFKRLGYTPEVIDSPRSLSMTKALVLPGVGTFASAVNRLKQYRLFDDLQSWVRSERPTFAICLGFQLLFASSEESPGYEGLSLYDNPVVKVPLAGRKTHFGWNEVIDTKSDLPIGSAYFAHSYCVTEKIGDAEISITNCEGSFVSMLRQGPLTATQFHPEISGPFGASIISSWLRSAKC